MTNQIDHSGIGFKSSPGHQKEHEPFSYSELYSSGCPLCHDWYTKSDEYMAPRPKKPRYLQRKPSSWYFRFRLPNEIQSTALPAEIRLSLSTTNREIARARARCALPWVHAIKQAKYDMAVLSEEVLNELLSRLIERLERQHYHQPLCQRGK